MNTSKTSSRNLRPFDYTSASLAAVALASAIVLTACGPDHSTPTQTNVATAPQQGTPVPPAAPVARVVEAPRPVVRSAHLGEVSSIEAITDRPKGSGGGAVIGGVLGGVLGHQVGSGNGNTLATAAGAVGGAVLGNKVERDRNAHTTYRVHVRLDNGESRSFDEASESGLHVGDRVRIEGDQIHRV